MNLLNLLGIKTKDKRSSPAVVLPIVSRETADGYMAWSERNGTLPANLNPSTIGGEAERLFEENRELALYMTWVATKIGNGDLSDRGTLGYSLGFLDCYKLLKRQLETDELEQGK